MIPYRIFWHSSFTADVKGGGVGSYPNANYEEKYFKKKQIENLYWMLKERLRRKLNEKKER